MQGKLIVLEGLDGSGKSTQLESLAKRLAADGRAVRKIKLPDYDDPSSTLVRMYLGGEFGSDPGAVNAYAASAFYAVDRAANYLRKWKDDYAAGTVILADRYTTSNAYHQLQKLPRAQWDAYLSWLEDFEYVKLDLPKPDCVVYLDMPIDVSQRLMTRRYSGDEEKKDIHEANISYLRSCRTAALYAAEKLGWLIIDCAQNEQPLPIETIAAQIYQTIQKEFNA
ncbi:MAG: deoxynucleoside kinase [Clostridia bacterium]|nr:deoxynucleoside kinase [Clostridia bacterium]